MDNRQLAQQSIDALHALGKGDETQVVPLVELFSQDVRITNAALQLTRKEETARNGATRFWSEYKKTLGDCFTTLHHVTVDANSAGLFWTTEGQSPHGNTVKYDGVSLLEFGDDGKISFFRGYYSQ